MNFHSKKVMAGFTDGVTLALLTFWFIKSFKCKNNKQEYFAHFSHVDILLNVSCGYVS